MYSNTHSFNLESFQPFFVYIKKCRMFEDELICLDPRFVIERQDGKFIANIDSSYCDLTAKERIDFIAICGKNGLGKTTLLHILQNRNFGKDSSYTLFWKDNRENILAHDASTVVLNGVEIAVDQRLYHFDSIAALCANPAATEENSLERQICQMYALKPELYDEGRALFDGFRLGYSPNWFDEKYSLADFYVKNLKDEQASLRVPTIVEEHPTLHVLADIAQDNSFEPLFERLAQRKLGSAERLAEALRDTESNALDEKILRLLYVDGRVPSALDRAHRANDEDPRAAYTFDQHSEIRRQIDELSDRVDAWIARKMKGFEGHLWKGRLKDILWDHPFKIQKNGIKSGLSELSPGEYQKLRMRYVVTPYLFQDQIGWFYFDDADSRLHPEWSRRFVFDLVTAFVDAGKRVDAIKGKKINHNRRLTCVLVTHSPFILSDLMPQNILLLNQEEGRTRVFRGNSATFAGNIGQMFHTEFFMESTIGEFARQQIAKGIKTLDRSPTQEDFAGLEKLFAHVGDEVLRSLLLEKLRNAKN